MDLASLPPQQNKVLSQITPIPSREEILSKIRKLRFVRFYVVVFEIVRRTSLLSRRGLLATYNYVRVSPTQRACNNPDMLIF